MPSDPQTRSSLTRNGRIAAHARADGLSLALQSAHGAEAVGLESGGPRATHRRSVAALQPNPILPSSVRLREDGAGLTAGTLRPSKAKKEPPVGEALQKKDEAEKVSELTQRGGDGA